LAVSSIYHIQIEQTFKESLNKSPEKKFQEIFNEYVIKDGDTLYKIAKEHLKKNSQNVSENQISSLVDNLSKINNIKNPNLIFPNQVISFNNIEKDNKIGHTLLTPVDGNITSKFGMRRDPFTKEVKFHSGIDIAAPEGTPIKAAENGKVVFSGVQNGYGNIVVIQHKDGIVTKYAHNSKNIVKVGDIVKKGQVISLIGQTGRSTGPHLHFEVLSGDKHVNPLNYLNV